MTDKEHDLMMVSFEVIYYWLDNNEDQMAWRMYFYLESQGLIKAGDTPTVEQMEKAKNWYLTS